MARNLTPVTSAVWEARGLIRSLNPGASVSIVLPDGRFSRAEAVRQIGCAARVILGPGGYRVDSRTDPLVAMVWRVDSHD